MKLLMLGSGSYKSSLSIRMMAFAHHVSKFGVEPTIILPSADKYNDFKADKQVSLDYAKLVQPWQPKTKNAMLNLFPYLLTSSIAILTTKKEAIYLYKPTPINIMGLLPKLLSRTPIILDLDDLGSEVMKSENQSKLQYKLVEYCERLAIRYASAVVVASTFLELTIKDRFPQKPTIVIPNGVEPSEYTDVKKSKPRNAIYYFGAINRLSLIEDLLRSLPNVLKEVPGTKVTIVGGGNALEEAKALASDLGISENVIFTGWVNMLDIQKYVEFADIAICYQPDSRTVRAASNMKVFQYMAMGSYPVVSNVGDLSTYLKNGKLGSVVPPNNPNDLAIKLSEALKNSDQRSKVASAAREVAKKEYSWEARTRSLVEILKSNLKKTGGKISSESEENIDDPKKMPFLSVVVCSLNGGKIIGRTLESILVQDYPKDRFEVIVVDDGSTDNTVEVSQSYKGVKVLIQPENRGISAARNAGLAIAKGDIYVCSDDDCIYKEDWLRQIASGYQHNRTIGVGGYLTEMTQVHGVLNHYFSVQGGGFPPIVKNDSYKNGILKRLFKYIESSFTRLETTQASEVEVSELYGANSSFPISVLKSVNGWRENMSNIEDRDISKRILDKYPGYSFYAVRQAEVIHDPSMPLKKFLLRQYYRATDTFDFCRANNVFPPLFPFPILTVLSTLVGLVINPFIAPLIFVIVPQLLYCWWPYCALKRRQIDFLAFPYVQLAEETMETAGIIRAFITRREREKHAIF